MGLPAEMLSLTPIRGFGAIPLTLDWSRPLWGDRSAVDRIWPTLSRCASACFPCLFPVLWVFIGSVSSYDAYLTLKYEDSIVAMELNPIGQFLLHLDEGDPSLFMAIKFAGTVIVLGVLNLLHRVTPQFGLKMTGAVASFQAVLLAFLTL